MPVEIVDWYSRADIRRRRGEAYFVFGDNMERRGFGGQAHEARGEPNAIGVPTKHSPKWTPEAFFRDKDFDRVKSDIDEPFDFLEQKLREGKTVVLPSAKVGTGMSRCDSSAPVIFSYIQKRVEQLKIMDLAYNRGTSQ